VLRWLVGPLAWSVGGQTVRELAGKDRADALNSVRQIVLAGAAGLIALGGLGFTARNFYLSRRGQMTDRYTAAIALLASNRLAERIGGVFALETHPPRVCPRPRHGRRRTHRFCPRTCSGRSLLGRRPITHRWIRRPPAATSRRASCTHRPRPPPKRHEPDTLNLRRTDLAGAHLVHARLDHAALSEADLRGAYLTNAHLNGAAIWDTELQGAYMRGAQLLNADLRRVGLAGRGGGRREAGRRMGPDQRAAPSRNLGSGKPARGR